jgi:hypothetical protein
MGKTCWIAGKRSKVVEEMRVYTRLSGKSGTHAHTHTRVHIHTCNAY